MGKHRSGPRIPLPVEGVQVNFCKSPTCGNFGIPASIEKQPRGFGAAGQQGRDFYRISKTTEGSPRLGCLKCGEKLTLKSNQAIHEETTRFLAYLKPPASQTSCPTPDCINSSIPVTAKDAPYQPHTKTAAGSSRFRCTLCKKVFTVSGTGPSRSPIHRQKVHGFKNIGIFKSLVNKVAMKRICEMEEISYKTLVDHIRFIHRQCMYFAASRERRLPEMDLGERSIAVDRQDYTINWTCTKDKRNIILHGIGSADLETGYIFGMHLNYDPSLKIADIVATAQSEGDFEHPPAFRRFARLWLPQEYLNRRGEGKDRERKHVLASVVETYQDVKNREDTEVYDRERPERRLPDTGMQIHAEYSIYGHFRFLKHQLKGARRLVFYLDQESGIRAAVHSTFCDEILNRTCDAFYVRINKDLTIHEKERCVKESDRELEEFVAKNPHLSLLRAKDVRAFYLKEVLHDLLPVGPWSDEWLSYPFPNHSEPEKAVCWLSDTGDRSYSEDEVVGLFMNATLHPIDRFFMQIRRRMMPFERSIFSASSARRAWHAYAPYRPEMAVWLLDIYRVYYNFIKVGKDKMTPAMRLGLARGPIRYEDIIYFKP